MAWNTARPPRGFLDDVVIKQTTIQLIDKQIKRARDDKCPQLQTILEHRQWITHMVSLIPVAFQAAIAPWLVGTVKESNSNPEAFARIHANFPSVAEKLRNMGEIYTQDFLDLLEEDTFVGQLSAYFRDGDYRGITWRWDGKDWTDSTPLEWYPTFDEMEEQRKMYATKIFDSHSQLQKIVRHYGEEIGRYWESRYVCTHTCK